MSGDRRGDFRALLDEVGPVAVALGSATALRAVRAAAGRLILSTQSSMGQPLARGDPARTRSPPRKRVLEAFEGLLQTSFRSAMHRS